MLVAEASTVPRRDRSIAQMVQAWLQRNGGSIKDSANRITLLRNGTKAGTVEHRFVFASGLNQPFGMLLLNGNFYIANTDGFWRFPYRDGDTHLEGPGEKILDLPAGGYNNHWTRNLIANRAGTKLYVTVGSGSNVGENGIDTEFHRANILEFNPDGSGLRVFASGLRNPNGLAFAPGTDTLWTVVNERDMLGNDLVPDYLTSVKDGGFYGWPYSYWGKNIDQRVKPQQPDLVATAIVPDYALGSHVAALGLTFYTGDSFPQHFRNGVFIGEHGSWNWRPYSGYKVVFVPFRDGQPNGKPEDFVSGFMLADQQGVAYGRPVGVAVDFDRSAFDRGRCRQHRLARRRRARELTGLAEKLHVEPIVRRVAYNRRACRTRVIVFRKSSEPCPGIARVDRFAEGLEQFVPRIIVPPAAAVA